MEKINIDLTGVPKTLLLPLAGRAHFSRALNPLVYDERAVKLTEQINFDFEGLLTRHGESNSFWWSARAYHFDNAIKTYLKKHPQAVIVNLGAGLETEFYRVDNGNLIWVDVDLPEVIDIRKKLLSPPERVHYLACSVFDEIWVENVKALGDHYFFVAGGLFMYFTEEQVKSILQIIEKNFPQAEMIFDVISKRGLKYANQQMIQSGMKNATMHWGLDNIDELHSWFKQAIQVALLPYFKGIKKRLAPSLKSFLKLCFYDFFDKGGIISLKFDTE